MLIYYVYWVITWCFHYFAPSFLKRRVAIGKEHKARYREKLGRYNVARPAGDLIWFHVASVGEFNSVISLVRRLEGKYNVLITSVTLNAYNVFKRTGFKRAIHQFAPLDTPQAVRKFLAHWSPSVGVFIDSELWPNLLVMASERFNMINMNAKLSDRSARKWSYMPSVLSFLYEQFCSIMPCSLDDMQKISSFVDNQDVVRFIGNLKLATEILEPNAMEVGHLQRMFRDYLVIVAASTHPGEEELILSAYLKMRAAVSSKTFLIIAPRNTFRGLEILHLVNLCGMSGAVRSKGDKVALDVDVYIADTIGEMSLWYTISDIAIVGNSFIAGGGHNIVEPARLGNAIVVGPYMYNFKDLVSQFIEERAIVISDATALSESLEKLCSKKHYRQELIDMALKISDASDDIIDVAEEAIIRAM